MSTTVSPWLSSPAIRATPTPYWILRLGASACFIGHGAFGFITKAAWLPYFAVVGIPDAWAWRIMPLVGAVDVLAGMAVLFAPRGLPLVYMTIWALWTALLRPLAGESIFEAVERAGNYGVPLAFLLLTGVRGGWRGLLTPLDADATRTTAATEGATARVRTVLTWVTALLLAGHGALGALGGKAMLTSHYALLGLPMDTTFVVGWCEIAAAVLVVWRPSTSLLVLVAAWKLATESLFLAAGAPIWEVIERAGSYAAPLALAVMLQQQCRSIGGAGAK